MKTKALVQAVKRNIGRFADDFMFQLTKEEAAILRSQIVTSKSGSSRGGRRYAPYAFTEQGVAMLSSVLRSPRAVRVNIEIMRVFVRLRRMLATHQDLLAKLSAMEKKYDGQFRVVFQAIRALVQHHERPRRSIGFLPAPRSRSNPLLRTRPPLGCSSCSRPAWCADLSPK